MRAHVDRVHELGMKYILWYSVPFIGMYSQAWERFKDRLLYTMPGLMSTGVVDPRYPEVREYLIQLYEQAVREWDLDGFKLDFVDSFHPSDNEPASLQPGQDERSVNKDCRSPAYRYHDTPAHPQARYLDRVPPILCWPSDA